MNTLINFFKTSSQFQYISKEMFNNVYKVDHFAYRTFDISKIIKSYPFYNLEKDKYNFNNNVSAKWLSKESEPSIFVSQYNGILSDKCIKNNSTINLDKLNYYMKNNKLNDYNFYKEINNYDQYLSWTLLFKNKINHIAFLVDDINETHYEIENNYKQYKINNPSNPIQISKDNNLLQFSIKSETIPYKFDSTTIDVPYTFIEFVERKNNRTGFESENAEKIFESTK